MPSPNNTDVNSYITLSDNRDNSNVLGVLLIASEDMTNLFIDKMLRGIMDPINKVNSLTDVLYAGYGTWKEMFTSVVDLFVEKAKSGATSYVLFIGKVLSILYTAFADSFALFPYMSNFANGLIA